MATLPPWLNIQPSDYLQAAHSGAQLGMQIAAAQNRAQEAAAARDLQLRDQAQRQWEFQENLRQRASELAASREESARRLDEANRYHLASVAEAQAGHEAQAAHWRQMEEAAKGRLGEPKIHFGPNGEVLSYTPEEGVKQMRAPNAKALPLTIGESELAHATAKTRIENELDPLRKEIAGMSPTTRSLQIRDKWYRPLTWPLEYGPEKPNPEYSAATNKLAKLEASIGGIGGRSPAAAEPVRTLDTFGTPYPPAPSEGTSKVLTKDKIREFYDRAGNDKEKAKQLAREEGYSW